MTTVGVLQIVGVFFILEAAIPISGHRLGASNEYIPICYRDNQEYIRTEQYQRCNNPLYTTCYSNEYVSICCGPEHHCCNHNTSCCRNEPSWTKIEVAAVVTGSLAWFGNLLVILICVAPTCWRKLTKCLPCLKKMRLSKMKSPSKVHPDQAH